MTIYTPRTAQKQVQKRVQNHRKTSFGNKQQQLLTVAQIPPRKNRHAGGNCGKKHVKIDAFSSKFEHQQIRHAEGNCGKKHAKIDDFSSKFEHQDLDTPTVIAAKRTSKSIIFRRNSTIINPIRRWQLIEEGRQASFPYLKARFLHERRRL